MAVTSKRLVLGGIEWLVSDLFRETVSTIYDATGAGNFHLPGKALALPGVAWKASFPQPVYFPSDELKIERSELAAEFAGLFSEEEKDGGIGAKGFRLGSGKR